MPERNTKPAITIVIPAYNHEPYVRDAIESIKHQTFSDWELIVIDDGSTDNTKEIVDEYSKEKRIQIIHQENRGLSATLNRGLKLAKGRYFGFLPSDDAFYPEKLDVQLEWLEARPDLASVATHQTLIDREGRTISEHPLVDWFNVAPENREDFLLGLLERNFISAPSVLASTEVLRKLGGFDTECIYMQDYDLWFRLLKDHNMIILQRPLVYYRWHGKNLTREATTQSEEERARVLYKAASSLEPQDIFHSLSENPRPEIVAGCRALLNERLNCNRPVNIEELQALFDRKFRSLFEQIHFQYREAEGIIYPFVPKSGISFTPMNVMLEVPSLDQGGLEQVVHDLALGLQKRGNRVVVVCTERGGKIADRLKRCEGIKIEILPNIQKEDAYREILSRYKVDIVNTHYSFFGVRLAADAGLPVVSVVHNIYAWLMDDILGAFRAVDPFISHYIAVSDDVARFMTHRFRVEKERITIVPNGLDLDAWQARKEHRSAQNREAFGLVPDDYVFLTVAAINRTKGQDRIIKIFPELLECCPNVKALFLGHVVDQQFHRYLQYLVHQNGLEDKIIFAPYVPDAAPFYRMADAFVLPSVVEGWSLAMMEAMFFGLPLIMSAVGGARTAVGNDSLGILVRPPYGDLDNLEPHYQERYTMMAEDPTLPELLKAMNHFCKQRDKWKKTGALGVSKVIDNYSLSRTVTSYERIFWSVVAYSKSHFLKQAQEQIAEEKRKSVELREALNASQSMIGRLVDYAHISAQLIDKESQLRKHEANISILRAEKDQLTRDLHAWESLVQTIYASKAWRFISAYREMRQGLSRSVRRTGKKVILDWGIDVPKMKRKIEDSTTKAVTRAKAAVSKTNNTTVSSTVNILTPSFFDREGNNMFFGGAERYLIDLTHLIRDWGYNVEIYQPASFSWIRYYQDINVHGFVCGEELEEIGQTFDKTIPKGSLTIYHAFYLTADAHSQSCPSIGISHGNYWDTSSFQESKANFERHVQRILNAIRHLNKLVCVDTNTINWLRAIDYYLSSKTTYIPNYVDLEQFKPSPLPEGNEIVICFPRRLYKPRGFYLLLENVDFLLSRYPNVQIHFVGKAGKREADIVSRLVKESKGRVQWYNYPPEEMYKVYDRSHIVLVPTVSSEGTSFSCLEAMACGRAVIVTDVGGLPNLIIDGYNGRMIPPKADALRSALMEIIESPSVRRDLGRKAREVVEKGYSKALWEKRWNKTLADFLPKQESISAQFQKPTVVYPHTPFIRWSFMQQRPQQLCLNMAEAGLQVFFYSDDIEDVQHSSGNLQILRPGDDLYLDSPVLYIHYPFNYPKIGQYSNPLVLYDVLDDINIYSGSMREEAIGFHDRLMKEADIVVCSSRRLLEKLRTERNDVVLVANAVRPKDFQNVNIQIPDDLVHILQRDKPIVGYVGAFGDWFDFDLYNEVTEKAEDCSFILIGPDYMRNIKKIAWRNNVTWLGAKPYKALPSYYAHMDVGIIPFRLSEVTHCTSPIKLFEYMASGKPVVTTDMAECRIYSPAFRASSAEDFVNCLRTAIETGKTSEYQTTIANLVKENTWAMRAELLNDLIQKAWERRRSGEKKEVHEHKILA